MPKSSAFTLSVNNGIKFNSDAALPQDISDMLYRVSQVNTLVLNDFYFNNTVFSTFQLHNEAGNVIYLTPFKFNEDDEELKIRISKTLSKDELNILFAPNNPKEVLDAVHAKAEQNHYISINEGALSKNLENWVGRAYYADAKEREVAHSFYIDYDSKNKKNLNHDTLLAKHSFQKYYLFQGDYSVYYLEVNFKNDNPVMVTIFLNASDIAAIIRS